MKHVLNHTTPSRNSGFTIVEVGIIVPIMMIFVIGLFTILVTYTQSSGDATLRLNQTYGIQDALDRFESDIKLSPGMLTATQSSTPDLYSTFSNGGAWDFNGKDANHRVLILNEYATTDNPLNSLRGPVYARAPASPICSTAADTNGLLTYTVVYFIAQNTTNLYRRILLDTTTPRCTTPYQLYSCPDTATLGGSRDPSCLADDELIATNVSQLSVDYYADGSTPTKLNVYGGSPTDSLTSARSANITIGMTQRGYGDPVSTASSLRVATINLPGGSGL